MAHKPKFGNLTLYGLIDASGQLYNPGLSACPALMGTREEAEGLFRENTKGAGFFVVPVQLIVVSNQQSV
jgi:hypothetical protein